MGCGTDMVCVKKKKKKINKKIYFVVVGRWDMYTMVCVCMYVGEEVLSCEVFCVWYGVVPVCT